jgi:surfeit locus 1 family protein
MPSPGIQMGTKAPLAPPFPVVASFPSRSEIAQLLRESSWTAAAELVLLDAGEPDGYVRNWSAPGFPPLRHIAYAVQWFALALTLLVIYVATNLRRGIARGAGAAP